MSSSIQAHINSLYGEIKLLKEKIDILQKAVEHSAEHCNDCKYKAETALVETLEVDKRDYRRLYRKV